MCDAHAVAFGEQLHSFVLNMRRLRLTASDYFDGGKVGRVHTWVSCHVTSGRVGPPPNTGCHVSRYAFSIRSSPRHTPRRHMHVVSKPRKTSGLVIVVEIEYFNSCSRRDAGKATPTMKQHHADCTSEFGRLLAIERKACHAIWRGKSDATYEPICRKAKKEWRPEPERFGPFSALVLQLVSVVVLLTF